MLIHRLAQKLLAEALDSAHEKDGGMARFAIFAVALSLVGCTSIKQARLYDLDQAQPVLVATYKTNGGGKGPIWIGDSLEQASCKGEYVTVQKGAVGWGTIFNASGPRVGVGASTDTDQPGQAIVTCTDGRVIECEYLTGPSAGGGACRDNRARRYRLMF